MKPRTPAARLSLALAALIVMGCESRSPTPSDAAADAASDLVSADAVLEDAVPADTGEVDAGEPDKAISVDAAALDANPLDANPLDASVGDTGQTTEVVTCRFLGSSSSQSCSSSAGQTCSGTASCTVKVSGAMAQKLTWKSTCGGYAYTIVDGADETAIFQCGPIKDSGPPPDSGQSADGAMADAVPGTVTEVVTCRFQGSTGVQSCYSGSYGYGCSGTSTCSVKVTGASGLKLTWKSTCGGYAYTTLDGTDEPANFTCP
jgi:uncharacterized lipoprotein NlpE involved in copper resistance